MYKIMITMIVVFGFIGCGESADKSKKSTESSTMMTNAKMIEQARDTVSEENKRVNTTIDDVEKKQ